MHYYDSYHTLLFINVLWSLLQLKIPRFLWLFNSINHLAYCIKINAPWLMAIWLCSQLCSIHCTVISMEKSVRSVPLRYTVIMRNMSKCVLWSNNYHNGTVMVIPQVWYACYVELLTENLTRKGISSIYQSIKVIIHMCSANQYLHGKGELCGTQRRAKVSPWCMHFSCCGWPKGTTGEEAKSNSAKI